MSTKQGVNKECFHYTLHYTRGETASRNDVHFLCTFFQDTDATVGDGFAPLGPPLLPNRPSGPIL